MAIVGSVVPGSLSRPGLSVSINSYARGPANITHCKSRLPTAPRPNLLESQPLSPVAQVFRPEVFLIPSLFSNIAVRSLSDCVPALYQTSHASQSSSRAFCRPFLRQNGWVMRKSEGAVEGGRAQVGT